MSLLLAAVVASSVLMSSPVMKQISYRGGLVQFAIPASWVEEYEPAGGGTFYFDDPNSGTLRVSVLTFEKPQSVVLPSSTEVLSSLKASEGATVRRLSNGNAIREHVSRTREDGEAITLFWWEVANVMPPNNVRIATFSYTVLSSQEGSPSLVKEIDMLRTSIESAAFSRTVGL